MKQIVRIAALKITIVALLTNIKLPNGFLLIPLTIVKVIGSSLALFLAIGGGLTAVVGLLRREKFTALVGGIGGFLAVKYIKKVTAPHTEFDFSFGADWQERIPHHLKWRFRQQRYTTQPLPTPEAPSAKDFVIGHHYETGDPILADIWQPPDDVPRTGAGLIFLHSGGWHYMDKDYMHSTRPLLHYLAGQGYLIADVAYTMAPKAHLVPMVADVKRAVAWMKTNAADLQINPDRIVLIGGSAGAHLALLAAYTPNHPLLDPADVKETDTAVRGVVSYYGVSDVINLQERLTQIQDTPPALVPLFSRLFRKTGFLPAYGRYTEISQLIPGLINGLPENEPELAQLGSPITHAGSHCPATLLLNGTHDVGPDVDQHRQLHAALYQHHVACAHVEYDCADHVFDLVAGRWSPAGQAALYDLERFLALLI